MGAFGMEDQARAGSPLDVELEKWDQDFRFLLGCFQASLTAIREDQLATLVEHAFFSPAAEGERLPPRGSQALSMAFQLLNREWPFLSYLLHNVEFGVAAADTGLMSEYAALVENGELRARVLGLILEEHERTRGALDDLFGGSRERRRPRLLKAIAIRRHALDRLHREQIALLRAWRAALKEECAGDAERILSSLLVTVNAIAGGLKTTG